MKTGCEKKSQKDEPEQAIIFRAGMVIKQLPTEMAREFLSGFKYGGKTVNFSHNIMLEL